MILAEYFINVPWIVHLILGATSVKIGDHETFGRVSLLSFNFFMSGDAHHQAVISSYVGMTLQIIVS